MATDLIKLTRRLLGLSEGTLLIYDGGGSESLNFYSGETCGYYYGSMDGNGGTSLEPYGRIWHRLQREIQQGGL